MLMRYVILLIGLMLAFPAYAHQSNSRISTFLEGQLLERTAKHWVIQTTDGVYWVDLKRPPSWVRRNHDREIVSFWVRIDQIARYRPGLLMRSKKTYIADID